MPEGTTYVVMDDFLELDARQLMDVKDNTRTAFLNADEMLAVQGYFKKLGRPPTDAEFYMIDQHWCEHSAHGTGNGEISVLDYSNSALFPSKTNYKNLLRETILGAIPKVRKPFTIAACEDDAGVMFACRHKGRRTGVCKKTETHNYPFGVSPFGGVHTGTGGVIRDIYSVFGEPTAELIVYCLPRPDMLREEIPEGVKAPLVYLEEGVAGNQDYGNDMGIPTLLVGAHFNARYMTNPLVFAGSFGVLNLDNYKYDARPGDIIISIGGRTGRDGIGGASGSSKSHTTQTAAKEGTAVQIGNPIEEQHWGAIIVEKLFDSGKIKYIQDCGGGGYSSSVWESAGRIPGGCGGATVYLDTIPVKEEGLTARELILSESQERQIAIVRPKDAKYVLDVCKKYGVEAAAIGHLTGDGKARAYEHRDDERPVVELDMTFLQKGKPKVKRTGIYKVPILPEPKINPGTDLNTELLGIMSNFNVASKEPIIRRFDHQVQGRTVIQPLMGADLEHLAPNDAAVSRLFYDDDYHSQVISYALNPRWGQKDMKRMVRGVFDQALRNNIVHGGNIGHMTVGGNWCMANMKADDEEIGRFAVGAETFGQCERDSDLCIDMGKDSMNNSHTDDKTGKSYYIPPTLLVGVQSIIKDARATVSSYAKRAGNHIYVIGLTKPELGGSIFHENRNFIGNAIPSVNLRQTKRTYAALSKLITKGIMPEDKIVRACHSVTEGGVAAAAVQMAIGGKLGMTIDLGNLPIQGVKHDYEALFSESLGRLLVEVQPGKAREFERGMRGHTIAKVGELHQYIDPRFDVIGLDGEQVIMLDIDELNDAWKKPLRGYV
jgi:phosphoribosylformylglycinamidine synthase